LSWLSTQGRFIVDENGNAVYLRGVTVTGLDSAAPVSGQTLAQAISLDDANLSALSDGWGVNLIRIPFVAGTILSGNRAVSAGDLLSGLGDLIAGASAAGCYVLLTLKPAVEASHILPADNDYFCCRALAERYQDNSAVLYEPFASSSTLAPNWLGIAQALIGTIRRAHPASLLFIGNGSGTADVRRLPMKVSTGDPLYNLVYTIDLSPALLGTVDRQGLAALAQSYPVFAAGWSDGGADFGRSSELAADMIERFGLGWAAANWNSEPRLVLNAAARQFAPTRWGRQAQRLLAQPVPPLLAAFS
jgi:hypothetical protein